MSAPRPSPAAARTPTPERILQRLEWQVIRRLDGLLQGDYRTLFYGVGVDFADLREYQAEDDIRHIDWNVTARMNSPYVRQFVEDREITGWFLLDKYVSHVHVKDASLNDGTIKLAGEGDGQIGELLFALQDLFDERADVQPVQNAVVILVEEADQ